MHMSERSTPREPSTHALHEPARTTLEAQHEWSWRRPSDRRRDRDSGRGEPIPQDMEPHIRTMELHDLQFVARQHLIHFPHGFFARLGPRYLREYYRSFVTSPYGVTLIAEHGAAAVGYLVGATDPVEHRRHVLRQHGRTLAWHAMLAMCTRPSLAIWFLRTRAVRYAGKLFRGPEAIPRASSEATAVLAHVAVDPAARSRGIGTVLITGFEAQVASAGSVRITLVTAAGANGAGAFYLKRGWTSRGEHCTRDGQWLTTFTRAVPMEHTTGPARAVEAE